MMPLHPNPIIINNQTIWIKMNFIMSNMCFYFVVNIKKRINGKIPRFTFFSGINGRDHIM